MPKIATTTAKLNLIEGLAKAALESQKTAENETTKKNHIPSDLQVRAHHFCDFELNRNLFMDD